MVSNSTYVAARLADHVTMQAVCQSARLSACLPSPVSRLPSPVSRLPSPVSCLPSPVFLSAVSLPLSLSWLPDSTPAHDSADAGESRWLPVSSPPVSNFPAPSNRPYQGLRNVRLRSGLLSTAWSCQATTSSRLRWAGSPRTRSIVRVYLVHSIRSPRPRPQQLPCPCAIGDPFLLHGTCSACRWPIATVLETRAGRWATASKVLLHSAHVLVTLPICAQQRLHPIYPPPLAAPAITTALPLGASCPAQHTRLAPSHTGPPLRHGK